MVISPQLCEIFFAKLFRGWRQSWWDETFH